MARRRAAEKRKLLPDYRYNDVVVTRFINYLMKQGKRTLAERMFYQALDQVAGWVAEISIEGVTAVESET